VYTRLCAFLARVSLQLAVAGLVAIIVCVTLQVFGRYVLNDTPTWAEALAMLLVLYVTMLGAAVGVREAGHIGLESLLVLVPDAVRLRLEMLIHVLVGLFGVLMAWNGGALALSVMDYKIPTLALSEAFNQAPIAIAGVLIALFSVEHLVAMASGREITPAWL
jgi:TRAP-type C4-dicarboxylate transport system permease small subunit